MKICRHTRNPHRRSAFSNPSKVPGRTLTRRSRRFAGWNIPVKLKSSSAPSGRTIRWWQSFNACKQNFPNAKIQLIFAELQGTNRKTSIMEAMWQKANGEFLFFSDADVVAPKNYLRQLVPRLAQPEVGCLTCLPRGIAGAHDWRQNDRAALRFQLSAAMDARAADDWHPLGHRPHDGGVRAPRWKKSAASKIS